jgi:tetratricopeptide (TPR) repeat protein
MNKTGGRLAAVGTGWLLAALVGAGGIDGLEAQTAEQRRALAAFRDSLSALPDTTGLRALESRLLAGARRDRANALLHMHLGAVAEGLGGYGDAASEFKWAAQLEPRWPAAWFAWARAELRLGDRLANARTTRELILVRDAWPRAEQALAHAIELDSAYADLALAEARRAVDAGRTDWARVIRDGLRRAAIGGRARPTVAALLALGALERAIGDTAGAVAAFEQAATLPGGKGVGLLERARTQLTGGDSRGIQAYFDGVAVDDPISLAGFRADLSLVASPLALARFDQVAGEERSRLLWEFWIGRDRDGLRRNGERLIEHYRRIGLARSGYAGLDDLRAQVLVRQGEPASRATLRLPGLPANESWWYPSSDGDMVVHFVARSDSTDFRLAESIFELLETDPEARTPAGDDPPSVPAVDLRQLIRSRAQLAPLYQAAADGRRAQLASFRIREVEVASRGRRLALTTDRHPIRFARDLAARVQLAGLTADTARGDLHAIFAVPGFTAAPAPEMAAGVVRYPIRIRLVVRDSGELAVRAVDSTLVIERSGPAGPDERLLGSLIVPLPPGRYRARIAVQYGEAGSVMSRDSIVVTGWRSDPDALALGDLFLGGAGSSLALRPGGGEPVPVDPAPALDRGDSLLVFAELVGARGEGGRVRALIRPVGPPDREPSRWRPFPGRSEWTPLAAAPETSRTPAIRLALPLRRVVPGAYEVQLVVVDGSGATAWREGRFEVRR